MLTGQRKWEETSGLETSPVQPKPFCFACKFCRPWHGAYLEVTPEGSGKARCQKTLAVEQAVGQETPQALAAPQLATGLLNLSVFITAATSYYPSSPLTVVRSPDSEGGT